MMDRQELISRRKAMAMRHERGIDALFDEDGVRVGKLLAHTLDCLNIAKNLHTDNTAVFFRFFEKLYNKDKRVLALYIRGRQEYLSERHLEIAKAYYKERGHDIEWGK